jgi:hypothetical protein
MITNISPDTRKTANFRGFEHIITADKVHILTMRDDSRQTADALLAFTADRLQVNSMSQRAYAVLIDQTHALPVPLNYTFTRLRSLIANVDEPRMFVAILIDNKMLATVMTTFIKSLHWKITVQAFGTNNRHEALSWLSHNVHAGA